ncbi:radical SAM protein [Spirochaetia bacterium]|nr:radical SAM protein [Spirochaetia bacterium]
MKVGLIDVDGHHFPNIALMKISAYHKQLGDIVCMYLPLFDNDCDIIYKSKVFTFTPDITDVFCDNIILGGTGYNLTNTLPKEIDDIYPDYSLYNITNTAYGYLTRGCPRDCGFCIVTQKEGNKSIQKYKLDQFYRGQKEIKLLDPNITAAPNCIELINELSETKAYIDFTQGLDLRLMTNKLIKAIKKCKIKMIHFAWDKPDDEKIICENLELFIKESGFDYQKVSVFVLVNYNSTFEEDLYRIYKIRDIGANPYVMIYEKNTAHKNYYKLQRYVNSKYIFRTIKSFEEYK